MLWNLTGRLPLAGALLCLSAVAGAAAPPPSGSAASDQVLNRYDQGFVLRIPRSWVPGGPGELPEIGPQGKSARYFERLRGDGLQARLLVLDGDQPISSWLLGDDPGAVLVPREVAEVNGGTSVQRAFRYDPPLYGAIGARFELAYQLAAGRVLYIELFALRELDELAIQLVFHDLSRSIAAVQSGDGA